MNPRITVAAAAVLSLFAIATPARAGHPGSHTVQPIDVAAIPAYPMTIAARSARKHPTSKRQKRFAAPSARAKAPSSDTTSDGSGIVRSHKTGATARVSPSFAPIAQAVVDDMESRGAVIRFMGGYRRGICASYSLHPCGLAIDLCQTRRGVVDPRCLMPSRATEIQIARAHGAYSGGEWCNQDRGHIQKIETAAKCGSNLYAAVGRYHRSRKMRLAAH